MRRKRRTRMIRYSDNLNEYGRRKLYHGSFWIMSVILSMFINWAGWNWSVLTWQIWVTKKKLMKSKYCQLSFIRGQIYPPVGQQCCRSLAHQQAFVLFQNTGHLDYPGNFLSAPLGHTGDYKWCSTARERREIISPHSSSRTWLPSFDVWPFSFSTCFCLHILCQALWQKHMYVLSHLILATL